MRSVGVAVDQAVDAVARHDFSTASSLASMMFNAVPALCAFARAT